jgi:hypothetical protein
MEAPSSKKDRVEGYMNSTGMSSTLAYQDNDATHGLVETKSSIKDNNKIERKETWAPKTTASRAANGAVGFYVD